MDEWSVAEARQALASYADALYKDRQQYVESSEFIEQQKLLRVRQGKAKELSRFRNSLSQVESSVEVVRAERFMSAETANDDNEFQDLFLELEKFLLMVSSFIFTSLEYNTVTIFFTFKSGSRELSDWYSARRQLQSNV